MKPILHYSLIFTLFMLFSPSGWSNAVNPAGLIQLPAGTPVSLKLNEEISSQEVEIGHTVEFVVRLDVVINQQVVIATHAYAEGIVTDVEKYCGSCRPKRRGCGKVVIKVESVQAVDGQRIYLNGSPMKITGDCCGAGGPAIAHPEKTYRATVLNNVKINL